MPSDPITVNRRGDVFVAFHKCPEDTIPAQLGPITHALIAVTQGNKSLLLFNGWKKRWELPGGIREEGESPRECALRELEEETNQKVTDAEFRGLLEFRLQPDARPAQTKGSVCAAVSQVGNKGHRKTRAVTAGVFLGV